MEKEKNRCCDNSCNAYYYCKKWHKNMICKKCNKCGKVYCIECCPPGSCTCPEGSCTCPPGSCTCPEGSCTCPPGSCTCPEGSCTCPEGSCARTKELVENPSFELACPDSGPGNPCNVFAYWIGTNIETSDEALTGNAAAFLGSREPDDASLEQTVCGITPNCYYDFSFSVNAQKLNNANGVFRAKVFWQPSGIAAINNAVNPIMIDKRFSGNNYVFIRRETNLAPTGTNCARIVFTKTGTGKVLIDDVSFTSL